MDIRILKQLRLLPALLLLALLFPRSAFGQLACPSNIDLELGNTSSWNFFVGYNGGLYGLGTLTSTTPMSGRHTITSGTGTDYYGGFPVVSPGGGNYSLKLGNSGTGAQVDQAQYILTVPTGVNNYSLIYRYAVVFEDPQHPYVDQPFFYVTAYDSVTGAVINCSNFNYVAQSGLPGFLSSPVLYYIYYKSWATASLNLSGQAGRTIVIEFTAGDCAQGGHFGYGYVDMSCGLFAITNTNCNSAATTPLSAPAGFQTYTWYNSNYSAVVDTGQSIVVATPSTSTIYHVVLTPYAGYGCTDTLTTSITTSALAVNAGPDTMVCNNASVQLQGSATGAGAPYSYAWAPATGLSCTTCANPAASPTTATSYVLTATDANGCTKKDTVLVNARVNVTATTTQSNACSGTGSATAAASGGTAPYTYSWNTTPAQTAATATGLGSGTYIVTATDSKGCTDTQSIIITQAATTFTAAISAGTDVSCFGGANGTATVTPSGGTAPYTYSWNTTPAQTAATATGLSAGTYTVTVTDANACTAVASAIIAQPPSALTATVARTNVSCFGGANGTITATPSGGTAPYSFAWNTTPAQATATATGLASGSYTVTVTDSKGCTTTSGAAVTQPSAFTATAAKTDVSCFGGVDGTASVTPSGGTVPYTYSWNTAPIQTTATATGLAAGSFTVTVTDSGGCTATAAITIAQPTALGATTTQTNVTCSAGGTATAIPSGGTSPYAYNWNTTPAQTLATATGLSAGTYTAAITDAKGCTTTVSVTITQSSTLTVSSAKTDVSCFGGANGTATASVSGGAGPYSYSWNSTPVQTSATATGLSAGTYTITVTDANACTSTASAIVTEPIVLGATITKTNVSCHGGINGTATAVPSGGTAPFTYHWNTTPAQTGATATGLVAGSYAVTITDSKGCTMTAGAAITQPSVLSAAISKTDVSCFGGTNGTVTVATSGGTAPYAYGWSTSPVQNAATAIGLPAGNYAVTVTDSGGCTTTVSATIIQPTALSAATTQTNVTCSGGGTATAIPSGGTAPYTYSWNTTPVQTSATATSLPAGSYTATIIDLKGCTTNVSVTITQSSTLTATATKTDVACFGGANGTAAASVSGGAAPYTYSWNTAPAQTSASATGLSAGSYTVTITDANACTSTATIIVAQPVALSAATTKTNVSCFGGSNGTATVSASGGTAPYSYSWNTTPIQTAGTATGLPAGSYTVTVTDANGCSTTANAAISQSSTLTAAISKIDVSCFGGLNGVAAVTASGGRTPYTYSWNATPAQTTATATGLAAGSYTVTVTDSGGCTTAATTIITQPTALSATTTQTNVTCSAGGTATAIPSGGTSPYAYSWNTTPAQASATATSLSAGAYTATITDSKGCTTTVSATITQSSTLTVSNTRTDVSCFGGSNGSATASVSGGVTPYTYSWNTTPAQTSATATGLSAGTYTVTVTDANACTATAIIAITQPAVLSVTATQANVGCGGGATGTATAAPSGGTAPYGYSWNTTPAQTVATATSLPTGSYAVTITDSKGCTTAATVTITQSSTLTLTGTKTDVACFGGANGTATASAAGGIAPYSYSWNTLPAQTTTSATGLSAGTYTVTATDSRSCTSTATIIIAQPAALAATTTKTDVACFGAANGAATVIVTGGILPYTYSWNTTPVQTSASATGLSAGTYIATVTDSNGCAATASATIAQPAVLTATVAKTDVSCFGNVNGTAAVSASGGNAPYTYSWNTIPAQTTATATGLSAGSYSATITDSRGCTTTATVAIIQPTALSATTTRTNANCNTAGGTATAIPSGGTPPYTYNWNTSPAQTAVTAGGLSAGSYTVTITDLNGCIATAGAVITQPSTLAATISQTDVSCFGGMNGTATVTPSGGRIPYTYSWNSIPAQTTATATGLAAGSYAITVTDSGGCATTMAATIAQPAAITVLNTKTDASCFGSATGTATAVPSGGTAPYAYSWNTAPAQTTATATALPAGSFTVTVTDARSCTATAVVTILQPAVVNAAFTQTNVRCNGGTNGTATTTATGGTSPYTFSWNTIPAQTGATATGLAAGTYTVTVSDVNGCMKTANVTITQPAVLVAITTGTGVSCNGGANGTATVAATGGTSPYTYSWNTTPAQTTATATGLVAGSYAATITDSKGCTATAGTAITQPTAIATTGTKTDASCFGGTNGTATVSASGGLAPYTYSWNTTPVQTAATATGLSAGSYTVTVTDGNGCAATANVTVAQPPALAGTITPDALTCNGNNTGAATAVITGGTSPYTYLWSTTPPQTGAIASGLAPGSYTLSVTDAHNCGLTLSTTVTEPAPVTVSATTTDARCNGGTGGIALQVTGGTTPYTYAWSTTPVQTTATTGPLPAGTYTATVTDANGCVDSTFAVIEAPAPITLSGTVVKPPCPGASDGTMSVGATGGTAPFTFIWNTAPPKTGAIANNIAAGNYTVTATDANGCTDTMSMPVQSLPTDLHAGGGGTICKGATANLSATGAVSYKWSPATGLSCIACATPVAAPASSTYYTVLATDSNKCTDSAVVFVAVIQRVPVGVGPQMNICKGSTASLRAFGGVAYSWSPGASLNDSTLAEPVARPDAATSAYQVIITENECFSDTLTQKIGILPAPELTLGPDFKGIPGAQIPLNVYSKDAGYITWIPSTGLSCNGCFTPTVTLTNTITYIAEVSNEIGCTTRDTLTITVGCDGTSFFMANAFTPNGDGQNDRFYPQGKGVSKVSRFLIYDRWGEVIFSASNMEVNAPDKGWDGTFRGRILKPDVYLYVVEASCSDGSPIVVKGDVTIIR